MIRLVWIAALAGCYAESDLVVDTNGTSVTSNAITLTQLCSGGCFAVADGLTSVTMQVCTKSEHRPSSLDVTLKVPSGSWAAAGATPSTSTTVSLAGARCATASFTPPTVPGELVVQATVGGVTVATPVLLAQATLAFVSMTPVPSTLSPTTTSVVITARANVTTAGTASVGTRFTADVNAINPPSASYEFRPSQQFVDANGIATFTLVMPPNTLAVAYTLTATTPSVGGVPEERTAAVQTIFATP